MISEWNIMKNVFIQFLTQYIKLLLLLCTFVCLSSIEKPSKCSNLKEKQTPIIEILTRGKKKIVVDFTKSKHSRSIISECLI
jgi:hypothetical protein